ncbi:hypothetical protein DV515_00009702 [Chloebia gouldiae]|uniref:Uncharacterized protein n=1 Tax=Chloebia gouldiae TaxID=44316 RepID=A0A3L8SC24_CHLGU|nr:hypothetical protein DV515_00009702 [Chloebia gouldiae]
MGICFDTAFSEKGEGCAKILYQSRKKSPALRAQLLHNRGPEFRELTPNARQHPGIFFIFTNA